MTLEDKPAPEYKHICKYCNETLVTIRLEEVTKGRTKIQRWVARNKLGEVHNCIIGRY